MQIFEIAVLISAIVSSTGFALAYYGFRRLPGVQRSKTIPGNDRRSATGNRESPETDTPLPENISSHADDPDLPVTVIIAAHNEAGNIEGLLNSVADQEYPSELLHLILAVDRSSDGTADAARAVIENLGMTGKMNVSILEVDTVPAGVSPKKFALINAIDQAETKHLLFTDADCRPDAGWVRNMVEQFKTGADVVIGFAPLLTQGGFVSEYAVYEAARTAMSYTGAAGLGFPYMATGRNWGYTKDIYDRAGGLEPLTGFLGGDDDLLFQNFFAAGAAVRTCLEPGSGCPSPAPKSLRQLWRQKLRHYSVASSYRYPMSFVLGAHAAAQSFAVLGAGALVIINGPSALWTILFLLLGKLALDTCFLFPMMRLFRRPIHIPTIHIPIDREIFHVLFSGAAGLSSMFIKPRW